MTASSYQQTDPLLIPFVRCVDEVQAQAHLERLIYQCADPLISEEVQHHFQYTFSASIGTSTNDAADLRGEMVRQLVQRVGAIRYNSASPLINLVAYIRITVRYLCWQHFRRIRRERNFSSFDTSILDISSNYDFGPADITEVIPTESDREDTCNLIEQRGLLQTVWAEICALPKTQRIAVLYNFRDKNGTNALPLLPLCSVATPDELAGALDVAFPELETFLDQLPLEDSQIAVSLGVSAREVINLRATARRRLKRRVRAWLEPAMQD